MYDSVRMPVRVSKRTEADKCNYTTMEVEHLSMFERMFSAAGALAVCWFAGVIFIAVPVMHFVLVPLAAVAGLVAFGFKLTRHERRTETSIKCPGCMALLRVKPAAFNWPIKENCGECRIGLIIEPRIEA